MRGSTAWHYYYDHIVQGYSQIIPDSTYYEKFWYIVDENLEIQNLLLRFVLVL